MNIHYHNFDLLELLDLLTDETKKYTKAIKEGVQDEIYRQGLTISSLIAEIKERKSMAQSSAGEVAG